MQSILIKNANIVNRNEISNGDIMIRDGFIDEISPVIDRAADLELDAEGLHAIPGIIDDQVHFREPGLGA